jgi:hypothetical protein
MSAWSANGHRRRNNNLRACPPALPGEFAQCLERRLAGSGKKIIETRTARLDQNGHDRTDRVLSRLMAILVMWSK